MNATEPDMNRTSLATTPPQPIPVDEAKPLIYIDFSCQPEAALWA